MEKQTPKRLILNAIIWMPTKFWVFYRLRRWNLNWKKNKTKKIQHTKTHCHHVTMIWTVSNSLIYIYFMENEKTVIVVGTLVSLAVLAAKACESNVSTLSQLLVLYWTIGRVQCSFIRTQLRENSSDFPLFCLNKISIIGYCICHPLKLPLKLPLKCLNKFQQLY